MKKNCFYPILIMFISVYLLTACGQSDPAEGTGSIESETEAPAQLSNEDIDSIIEITNNYLLGNISNDQATTELIELYKSIEEKGVERSEDMTMLFALIDTSPDPKTNKKEIMKYRNRIAILAED